MLNAIKSFLFFAMGTGLILMHFSATDGKITPDELRVVVCHYATLQEYSHNGQPTVVQDNPKIIQHILHQDDVSDFVLQQVRLNNQEIIDPQGYGYINRKLVRVRVAEATIENNNGIDMIDGINWQVIWQITDPGIVHKYRKS